MERTNVASHCILYRELPCKRTHGCLGFLLAKRTLETYSYPSHWSLFGGTRDQGEDPTDCILRELNEEIGPLIQSLVWDAWEVDIPVYRSLGKLEVRFYAARVDAHIKDMSIEESNGFAFFTVEELEHIQICPEHRKAIKLFLEAYYEHK